MESAKHQWSRTHLKATKVSLQLTLLVEITHTDQFTAIVLLLCWYILKNRRGGSFCRAVFAGRSNERVVTVPGSVVVIIQGFSLRQLRDVSISSRHETPTSKRMSVVTAESFGDTKRREWMLTGSFE